MQATKIKLEYEICTQNHNALPAIIVAAGSSSRMLGQNKQFAEILHIPVIARTLMAFENSPLISKIILIAREEDLLKMQQICQSYNITKLSDIAAGGKNRHESVLNGIKKLDHKDNKVLIHDGARPLIDNMLIGNVTAALQNHDAVICAVPVKDTIKRADSDGFVAETVQRESLYAVQTPQGVDVSLYLRACEQVADSAQFTDDAAIMEAAGYRVKIVAGSYKNIKITTPEDIRLAEQFV